MSRFHAAATHFAISTVLASIVIGLIVFGWYPLPLFWDIGGPLLIALLVGVDVVLGPLMTLIVFNPTKPRRELAIDLTLIGLVQLGALSYGLYSGYMGRVAYAAFYQDEFKLVYAGDLAAKFVAEAPPAFQQVPKASLRYVGLNIPDDEKVRSDIAFFNAIGAGPERFPKFYVPLTETVSALRASAISRDTLINKHPKLTNEIDELIESQQLSWQDVAVLPFDLRTSTYTAVVNLRTATVTKVFRADPRQAESG